MVKAECCDLLTLVLSRAKSGITREPSWNTTTGGVSEPVIVRFAKNTDRSAMHADAVYAELKFCPFCAASLNKLPPKKRARRT
jgi:hypothetical protein